MDINFHKKEVDIWNVFLISFAPLARGQPAWRHTGDREDVITSQHGFFRSRLNLTAYHQSVAYGQKDIFYTGVVLNKVVKLHKGGGFLVEFWLFAHHFSAP